MKIFAIIFAIVAILIGLTFGQKSGEKCTFTGVQATDDSACGGNLLCGKTGTCVCPDVYGSSTAKFTVSADQTTCVAKS